MSTTTSKSGARCASSSASLHAPPAAHHDHGGPFGHVHVHAMTLRADAAAFRCRTRFIRAGSSSLCRLKTVSVRQWWRSVERADGEAMDERCGGWQAWSTGSWCLCWASGTTAPLTTRPPPSCRSTLPPSCHPPSASDPPSLPPPHAVVGAGLEVKGEGHGADPAGD